MQCALNLKDFFFMQNNTHFSEWFTFYLKYNRVCMPLPHNKKKNYAVFLHSIFPPHLLFFTVYIHNPQTYFLFH